MPNTTNGLPFPVREGVEPDVQKHIKDLAEAVDPWLGKQTAVAGRRYGGDNPSLANATVVPYPFTNGSSDYTGGVTAAANGGIAVPVAGWYSLVAALRWGNDTTGTRQTRLTINGTTVAVRVEPASTQVSQFVNIVAPLAAGDVVGMSAYHSNGTTISPSANLGLPLLAVALMGRV